MIECSSCSNKFDEIEVTNVEDDILCRNCRLEEAVRCERCGRYYYEAAIQEHNGSDYCNNCYDYYITCNGDDYSYHGVSQKDFI